MIIFDLISIELSGGTRLMEAKVIIDWQTRQQDRAGWEIRLHFYCNIFLVYFVNKMTMSQLAETKAKSELLS